MYYMLCETNVPAYPESRLNTVIIRVESGIFPRVCGFERFSQVTNPDRLTNVIQSAAWSLLKQ